MCQKKITGLYVTCSAPYRRVMDAFSRLHPNSCLWGWPPSVALGVPILSHSLPFWQIHLMQRARFALPVLSAAVIIGRVGIRGWLHSHSIRISLLKDLPPPILSLQRYLRSPLLIYNPKHAQNPQYGLSFHSNHVPKPLYSSLLYPTHLLDHLLNLLRLLHPLRLSSLRASCRRINGG